MLIEFCIHRNHLKLQEKDIANMNNGMGLMNLSPMVGIKIGEKYNVSITQIVL